MNLREKRRDLISYFQQTLQDQKESYKDADESQRELIEAMIEKTQFSLTLMEEGSTIFNGVKVELNDRKIEMMYNNYFGNEE